MTSVGIDIESRYSGLINLAKAYKWARLAWQQRSALIEGKIVRPGYPASGCGGDDPPKSKILNNSKTAAQNAAVFWHR